MAKLILTHPVFDIERWLKGKEERVTAFSSFAKNVTDHVALDGSNNVAISADTDDIMGAQAMMDWASAEAASQARSRGIRLPMMVYIEK